MGTKIKEADFIQVQLALLITISAYAEKVKAGYYSFPDFRDCCPICHAEGCAVRIGYYHRNVFDLQNNNSRKNDIIRIPVARYLCRKKGKTDHRTFSLLPDTLIPYYAITIDTFIFIIQQILLNNQSTDKALQSIDRVFPGEVMLSEKTLSRCYILFKQARLKLLLFFRKNRSKPWTPPDGEFYTEIELLHFILEFSIQDISKLKSNACKLSQFYYFEQGTHIKNAHFLFGTAAQFRK